ncbi:hypothetical protein E9229_001527 [Paeniglutamicibacter cryotolerans]|uniref:Uncharacterized protein n=1 Tax=Paeniglutamicibacter cryotolerans TaxID=670079 RepID=A0A839QMW3_9MICC|nr:hypothetical protein [Paeniglutamicibacter cryotolerans]
MDTLTRAGGAVQAGNMAVRETASTGTRGSKSGQVLEHEG